MLSIRASIFLLSIMLLSRNIVAQSPADSLIHILPQLKEDTTKVNTYFNITRMLLFSNPAEAKNYAEQSLKLAQQLNFNAGIANAYKALSQIESLEKNIQQSLSYASEYMRYAKLTGRKSLIANSYYNKGYLFFNFNFFADAVNNYLEALKRYESINDTPLIADICGALGNVYDAMHDLPKAEANLYRALSIYKSLNDSLSLVKTMVNIGTLKISSGKYDEALNQFFETLVIVEKMNLPQGIAICHGSIANCYQLTARHQHALEHYLITKNLYEQLGDSYQMAATLINLGYCYYSMKDYKLSEMYLQQGINLALPIRAIDWLKNAYSYRARLDSATGNFKRAFESVKLFTIYNDSLTNTENTRKIVQAEMQYDFDKKEAAALAEQEKKDLLQRNIRNSIAAGLLGSLIFLTVVYRQRNRIAKEKKRSESLLLNILPAEVAEELKQKGSADARQFDKVTVMFTDFKGFTQIAERLTAAELVKEIDEYFKAFDNIISRHNIEKIKTIGDAYMCAGGLPSPNSTHATDVVAAALEIQQFMLNNAEKNRQQNKPVFEIRIGIHTGPVVAGIVGVKKFAYDIWGDTVNIASRMESSGQAGKVNISGPTYLEVKDHYQCSRRGQIEAKNKGLIDMYFVESGL